MTVVTGVGSNAFAKMRRGRSVTVGPFIRATFEAKECNFRLLTWCVWGLLALLTAPYLLYTSPCLSVG